SRTWITGIARQVELAQMHDVDPHVPQSRYVTRDLGQGFMGQYIINMFGVEMARHGFIARKLSEGISIGKSLYVIYYRAVLFGGEQDKEIQPLLGIGRSVEPRHMAPVSHQVVPDAQAVFRQ